MLQNRVHFYHICMNKNCRFFCSNSELERSTCKEAHIDKNYTQGYSLCYYLVVYITNKYPSTWTSSTLIILFLELLEFSKLIFSKSQTFVNLGEYIPFVEMSI
jgi:hypothetical protein